MWLTRPLVILFFFPNCYFVRMHFLHSIIHSFHHAFPLSMPLFFLMSLHNYYHDHRFSCDAHWQPLAFLSWNILTDLSLFPVWFLKICFSFLPHLPFTVDPPCPGLHFYWFWSQFFLPRPRSRCQKLKLLVLVGGICVYTRATSCLTCLTSRRCLLFWGQNVGEQHWLDLSYCKKRPVVYDLRAVPVCGFIVRFNLAISWSVESACHRCCRAPVNECSLLVSCRKSVVCGLFLLFVYVPRCVCVCVCGFVGDIFWIYLQPICLFA